MGGTEVFKIFGRIGLNGVEDVNKKIRGVGDGAEGMAGKMTSAFKKVAGAVATYLAVDKVVGFGKACVDAAANVAAESAAFAQIMGAYSDKAQKKISEIADATGIVDTRLTPYMTSMTAKFKGLGYGVDEATGFAQRGLMLAADASAFWDKSLDESMSHLNSFINGSYEGGEAIGLFANDTQMAAYAVEQGIVSETKAWAKLDEATKQATRLEYAENMMKQSGATGQAAKEAGAYANVQANLTEQWRQFKGVIGEPILNNIVLPVMKKLTEILPIAAEKVKGLVEKVGNAWDWFKKLCDYVKGSFSPAIDALKNLFQVLKDRVSEALTPFKNWIASGDAGGDTFNSLKDAISKCSTVIAQITTVVTKFISWLNSGKASAEAFKAIVVAVTAAVVAWKTSMAIQSLIGNVVSNVTKAIGIFKTLWATMLANPITLIIAAITALVAGFIYLWNNCEGFRNFWINLWNKIKEVFTNFVQSCKDKLNSIKNFFSDAWNSIKTTTTRLWNNIKDAIMSPIEKARDKVKSVIDKIKSFFSFKISWPKIPMPHFGISPSGWKIGDLLKGSIPKLSIDWYAKGAVLENPTAFGINGNKVMVGGEAGKEAIAPIDTLQTYVKDAVRSELGIMESYMVRLVKTIDEYLPKVAEGRNVVLDSGALVGAMGSNIDLTMGNINRRKERWG